MKENHTPMPWRATKGFVKVEIKEWNSGTMLINGEPIPKEFILRSVNNFEELLEKSKELLMHNEANPKCYEDSESWFLAIKNLNEAIEKAEKGL